MTHTTPEHTATADDGADEPPPGIDPRIERTRLAVSEAAATLLLAEGPDAITHARVAVAANVSRTTVYKHWPRRADLLRSTIAGIGSSIPTADDLCGHLRDDLRTMLCKLASDLNDDSHARLIAMLIERSNLDPTVAEVRDAMVAELRDAYDAVLRDAVERNELRPEVSSQWAVASLAGALLFRRLLGGLPIDDEFLDHVIDDFIAANTAS